MAKTVAILLWVLFGMFAAQAQEPGASVGDIRDDGTYQLFFHFGIEQWEQGKLTAHRRQKWLLRCSYPEPSGKRSTWCNLDRVVVDKGLRTSDGDIVGKQRHNSSDGTLKIVNADWQRGVLDFTVFHADQSAIDVTVRLEIKQKHLYLRSFKARDSVPNTMTAIDYRIPKYTYMLNVPVKMTGLRTEEDREWDEMLATMSKEDQKLSTEFRNNLTIACPKARPPDEEVFRKIIPNYAERKAQIEKGDGLTSSEKAKIVDFIVDEWGKCFAALKASASSQKKVVGFLQKHLASLLFASQER